MSAKPFQVTAQGIVYQGKLLGPSGALYVDHGELPTLTEADGVIHGTPLRIDYLFVAGNRVVGCEAKRPSDLVGSTFARRLARQMRTLLASVDVACLVLRGGVPDFNEVEMLPVLRNLVALQALGVILLPVSAADWAVPAILASYRPLLANESRAALIGVAGTDKRKDANLLRAVKGIGRSKEEVLRAKFGSVQAVFAASDEELRKAGIAKAVIERMREMLK